MSGDKKEMIVAAAARAFGARGYAATTMDAVAEEAGIAKGSLYNYFDSKEGLFRDVFLSAIAADEQETDRLMAEQAPASAKLSKMIDNWAGQIEHYKRIGAMVLEAWAAAARGRGATELSNAINRAYIGGRDNIVAIVEQGIRDGEFSSSVNPEKAASLILGTMNGIILQGIMALDPKTGPDLLGSLRRVILSALKTEAEWL